MTKEETQAFLEHVGVKGMKWGVRRSPKQLANLREKRSSARPETQARKMSDTELKSRVERLRLEKEYVKISKELDQSKPVKSLLAKHGQQAASVAVGAVTSAIVGAALKNAFKTK